MVKFIISLSIILGLTACYSDNEENNPETKKMEIPKSKAERAKRVREQNNKF
jgi:lipoprotein